MGPPESRTGHPENQEGQPKRLARQPRTRCYLLKGCEQRFHPRQARQRYCSDGCQKAARKCSRWKAQERYRESAAGQQKRNNQSRRYRSVSEIGNQQSRRQLARPRGYSRLLLSLEIVEDFSPDRHRIALRKILDSFGLHRRSLLDFILFLPSVPPECSANTRRLTP